MIANPAWRGRTAIALWLVFLLVTGLIISGSKFTTDLSAFLPRSPTPEQQLLLDQIQDGLASRLILVGIEGSDAAARALLSRHIAQRLRADSAFTSVGNGEPVNSERDRAFLFDNRYLLSPAVDAERFSVNGLHAALSESIDLLASPAGLLVKSLLPNDPTGEMVQLLDQFDSEAGPHLVEGVWASRDGTRALLLVQTRAPGTDIDAQQAAMGIIRTAFDAARGATDEAKLVMTGPGVFSVTSRESIKTEVRRLFLIGVVLIATLLLTIYRSITALALGIVPVVSGALAGIAAVSLGFGEVHGITLGFGTALIGEAVDYSIYLFVQSEQGGPDLQNWIVRFWPTIRLGVLTSICGFAALLLSGFPGLAQLGLYAISGLIIAAVVTRFVLPHLLPVGFRIHDASAVGRRMSRLVTRAAALRWPAAILLLAAGAVIFAHRGGLWDDRIASLSPVSRADLELDTELRAGIGAPDVRYLVVVSGDSQESVLRSSEQVSTVLQFLVDEGELAGFETPSRYLPSTATQRARQASLPSADVLATRLAQAVDGLPVRAQLFAPFEAEIAAARTQPLLQAADLEKTSMAMAVEGLLVHRDQQWNALLPLTAPTDSGIDPSRIRAALDATGLPDGGLPDGSLPDVLFLDMQAETDRLYSGYLREAIRLSLGGMAGVVALLLLVFRSPSRALRNLAPLAAAVVLVVAGLTLFGQQLIIMHLVGLLLVVAVGSNYALFFDRAHNAGGGDAASGDSGPGQGIASRTLASLLFANLTTVTGFGVLAFSHVSILQAMGVTVAPGVILALIYSAIFVRKAHA
ncbi:MAG: MMPL family transporter [Lysobacterales bacterium]